MPFYFINFRSNAGQIEDPEGAEFDSPKAAQAAVFLAVSKVLAERIRAGRATGPCRFEICDEAGQVVAVVPLHPASLH